MLFRVCKTSVCDYSKKTYEDCIPIMVKRIDRRRFSLPKEFNEICGKREGNWFNSGKPIIKMARVVRHLCCSNKCFCEY